MHSFLFTTLALVVSLTTALPLEKKSSFANINLATPGTMMGYVKSATTNVTRDLGFYGQIGNYTLLTYGDTLYGNTSTFEGMCSDSVALATIDPLIVEDTDLNAQGFPNQFVPIVAAYNETMSDDAMGITNVINTSDTTGVVYFLKNHRPQGVNHLIGAGVATVAMIGNHPVATRTAEYWWDADTEAHYGDICAVSDGTYVYAYGHGNNNSTTTGYGFVTRAPLGSATELSAYEYWNGTSWQTERLYNPPATASVWNDMDQGQIFWSNHFNMWMMVYCDNSGNHQILMMSANSLTGPWSPPTTLYQAECYSEPECMVYSAVPHPYYDETGKTLVVSYTNFPNILQTIQVEFA